MVLEWILASVILVSLASFVGVVTLGFRPETLNRGLLLLVSFSAGAMVGDAFIHLIPEAFENAGENTAMVGFFVLGGILVFFLLERLVHWHHTHNSAEKPHDHDSHTEIIGVMNLVGDAFHNFIDGMIIAASFMVSVPIGIGTTIAVVLHELPQEFSDFGVLLYAGFSRKRALFYNFLSAITAIIGALTVFFLAGSIAGLENALIPIAAGGFIYIAMTDLLPEIGKETRIKSVLLQLFFFLLGIGIMGLLLLLE